MSAFLTVHVASLRPSFLFRQDGDVVLCRFRWFLKIRGDVCGGLCVSSSGFVDSRLLAQLLDEPSRQLGSHDYRSREPRQRVGNESGTSMRWRTFLLRSAQDGLDFERGLRLMGGSPPSDARFDDHEPENALASTCADELFWSEGEKVVVVHLQGSTVNIKSFR